MAKFYTTEVFISKAILIHPNKYCYNKVDYINSITDISSGNTELRTKPIDNFHRLLATAINKFEEVKEDSWI